MFESPVTILHIENRDAVDDRETRAFLRETAHPVAQLDTRGPDDVYGQSELHFFAHTPGAASRVRGNIWVDDRKLDLPGPEWTWQVSPESIARSGQRELPPFDRGRVLLGGDTETK